MCTDCVILEVAKPPDAKPFQRWLYPVKPPGDSKTVYCPVQVPHEDVVEKGLMPRLLAAWKDQGVVVPNEEDEIRSYFKHLGSPGSIVTLRGDIARRKNDVLGVRVATWPGQSGGFITRDAADVTTFCGIMCCSGLSDDKSNFNAALATNSDRFLEQYAAVVPTLPTPLPKETIQLLNEN